jgi:hypothetical protein
MERVSVVPGGVIGWMLAWGLWPHEFRRIDDPVGQWLPSATGKTLHLVGAIYTDEELRYESSCRRGHNRIELVPKVPLSPGDQYNRYLVAAENGFEGVWQHVAGAFIAWQRFRVSDSGLTHRDAVTAAERGLDCIRWVWDGSAFLDSLYDAGPMFSGLPPEASALLPWLVTGASNGITGLCLRCTEIRRGAVAPGRAVS